MFRGEDIRSDFPLLQQEVYNKPLVYLDSAATAQKPAYVIAEESRLLRVCNSNVHRGVHYLSDRMTEEFELGREACRRFINASSRDEIVFTSGATASLNMVAWGWTSKYLSKGDNIVVSEMEHHSNLVPWQQACLRAGAQLRKLPFTDDGEIDYSQLDKLIDFRTKVVAITQSSNTLGTQPQISRIIERAHLVGAIAVVDGCQGVVHQKTDVQALDCDFYAFSGHKLYGPTGIGVLWGRKELLELLPPLFFGGEMVDRVSFEKTTFAPLPIRLEAGTPNFIGGAVMAMAIRYVESLPMDQIYIYEDMLLKYAEEELERIDGLRIYGKARDKSPLVSFNIEGCDHYDLGVLLDKMGIAIRTGHHCAEPVMQHYNVNGMCRASFGMYTTEQDIYALVKGLKRAAAMLRGR